MDSRMNKYYDDNNLNTRYHRNEELYKEINKSELNNYDIKSNATIIGDNKNEIDVEKIKKILDTKYNELPKRRSIRLDVEEEKVEEKEPTKEYDINVIIEKAKEQKEDNYEEERLKKIHDTQFDILKKLEIEKEEESEEDDDNIDQNLKKLINTITLNEHKNDNDSSPLDILSDLKGSGDTEVLDGLKEEVDKEIENIVKEEEQKEKTSNIDTKMINSFYTSSNSINTKDFEDLDDDFKDSIESNSIGVKILIALIIIVFLVGVFLLIKTLYFK